MVDHEMGILHLQTELFGQPTSPWLNVARCFPHCSCWELAMAPWPMKPLQLVMLCSSTWLKSIKIGGNCKSFSCGIMVAKSPSRRHKRRQGLRFFMGRTYSYHMLPLIFMDVQNHEPCNPFLNFSHENCVDWILSAIGLLDWCYGLLWKSRAKKRGKEARVALLES